MSRSGKRPINVPKGVEIQISGQKVAAKGPKGNAEVELPDGVTAALEGEELLVTCDDSRLHGLGRAMANNAVVGVSEGHEKRLEMIGVGFRAAVKGDLLDLQLGFSHPTQKPIPEDLTVKVEDNVRIVVQGIDSQKVGQFAAEIRALRPPEPYKGKGVRYVGEYVRRKAGKAAKK